jgi:formamidopyrimidine-DNA glycosylase
MPELPEVETVVRTLAPRVVGRHIVELRVLSRRVVPRPISRAVGGTIRAVRRLGKHILFELDRGILDIHLGMTGALVAGGEPGPHTRAWLRLDRGRLIYHDPRMFGRIRFRMEPPAGLGPDALEIGAGEFAERLAARRGRVKPLLLDQRFLGGVGNIYADEALFGARIHPRARAGRLGPRRARRLHAALVAVLEEAIARGGTSISDYVDGEGHPGGFQQRLQVYGREGLPCVACGTPIRRVVLAGRGTHYCPRCQRI